MLFANIVTWDAPPQALRKDVWQALADVGLSMDLLPDMSERQAASRAASALKDKELQIDRLQAAGQIQYQLTNRTLSEASIEFFPRTVVVVDKWCVKTLTGSEQDAKEFEDAMTEAVKWLTGADVSRVVARAFDEHAAMFPVVPRKGVVYVVPTQYQELVIRVESFLQKIGGRLHKFPVPRDGDGESSVRDAISQGMEAMIAELQEAVEAWDETTRGSTQEHARQKWAQIQAKIEEYQDYVSGSRGTLEALLDGARARIEDRVLELAGVKQAAAALRASAADPDSDSGAAGLPGPALGASGPAEEAGAGID